MRNVVLVHGAYADGSSWSDVIERLQATGMNVTSVQNPLTSLAADVAATERALALQDGATILAAHSWGGTVISQAGLASNVTGLVYVAARAPDAKEDYTALAAKFSTPPANREIVESGGFKRLTKRGFLRDFAGGVPRHRALALRRPRPRRQLALPHLDDHDGRLAAPADLARGLQPGPNDRPGLQRS